MTSQIRNYQPDVIMFRAGVRKLDRETIIHAKHAAPKAFVVCWSISISSHVHPNILACAEQADLFISTSAGRNLEQYKKAGVKKCVYMPYPCDPDLEYRHEVGGEWQTDLLFTGTLRRELPGQDPMRRELIETLVCERGLKVWGGLGNPKVLGMDYVRAISGAKIGISVNTFNDVSLYHSNRFINYLACGTMVLSMYVPQSERLFVDGEHLRYFSSVQECLELIDYYLDHEDERQAIADAGMQRAHSEFNCVSIAKDTLDLITKGSYEKPWAVVL